MNNEKRGGKQQQWERLEKKKVKKTKKSLYLKS